MKPTEAAALLAIAASFDNRKPDADQATAWSLALDGIRFADARDAIVAHFKRSREWLMPVDVIRGAKAIRNARVLEFGPLPAPAHLDGDSPTFDRDYGDYIRATTRAIADGDYTGPTVVAITTQRDVIVELGQIGRAVPES